MWSHGSASSAVLHSLPPATTETSAESRYCGTSSRSAAAVAGAFSDGLSTTVLPAASAPTSGASVSCTG